MTDRLDEEIRSTLGSMIAEAPEPMELDQLAMRAAIAAVPRRRWSPVPAIAVAFVVVVVAVGAIFLVASPLDDGAVPLDEPTVTATTVPLTTVPADAPVTATTPPPGPLSSSGWSRVPHDEAVLGGAALVGMRGVTVGGPGLVAVGGARGAGGASDAAVWISLDGIAWLRVPHDEALFDRAGMSSVTAGGPGLVAVGEGDGESAAVWTSPDGVTWDRVPHDEAVFDGAIMWSVTVGGPGLVVVGQAGDGDAVVWTSADGVTWSRVPHDEAVFGGAIMRSVTVGGPGLVAVGSEGGAQSESRNAVVWTSPDGITWSRGPHNEAIFGEAHVGMRSVTVGGPGLVAVGWDWPHAAVWTSLDGITWSRVPHDEAMQSASCSPPSGSCFDGAVGLEMRSVTVGGPGLVAVGFDGHPDGENAVVWTSPDGITWSRVPHDEAIFGGSEIVQMNGVTADGPGLVAVGYEGSGPWQNRLHLNAVVWSSVDGLTWSRVPNDAEVFGGEVEMRSVTAGGPGLVAVGGDGFGSRSGLDAAVWNTRVED